MKALLAFITVALTVLPGCGGGPKHDFSSSQPNLGRRPVRAEVLRSVQAMGGMQALTTHTYRASAIVTQSGPFDSPMTWQVRMQIDPVEQTITASAPAGRGSWKATVAKGRPTFQASGAFHPTEQEKRVICGMLQAVLHRVSGPLNFYLAGEKATGLSTAAIDGQEFRRVGVLESAADIRAYYLDPQTHLIRYATATADAPNRPGTVTTYQWQPVRGGVKFPKTLRVVNIGQNALIGQEEVLSVEFTHVQSVATKRD